MGLNTTPRAERVQIAFFGRTNAGKSMLINSIAGQEVSITSDEPGTTTDPVKKTMEIQPLGPVVLIDTPGLDDNSSLGKKRVEKAKEILAVTDVAIVVVDITLGISDIEKELVAHMEKNEIPHLVVFNKSDLRDEEGNHIYVSAKENLGIEELKGKLSDIITGTIKKKL